MFRNREHTVAMVMISVTTIADCDLAGQSVTVAAQLKMVCVDVARTVKVVKGTVVFIWRRAWKC